MNHDLWEMENSDMEDHQTLCWINSETVLMQVAEKVAWAWYGEQGVKWIARDNTQMNMCMIKLSHAMEAGLMSQCTLQGGLQLQHHCHWMFICHITPSCPRLQATCPPVPHTMPTHPPVLVFRPCTHPSLMPYPNT